MSAEDPVDTAPDRAPSSKRRLPITAVAVVVLVISLAAWLGADSRADGAPTPASATPAATSVSPRASAVTAEPTLEPEYSIVRLDNLPPDAIVRVDGEPTQYGPLALPRDGRNRVIEVSAPGKTRWVVVHHASADTTYEVRLQDRAPPKVSRPPARDKRAPSRARPERSSSLRKLDF